MKKINDYYEERGVLTSSDYYNKIEKLLSKSNIEEYNDFITNTPLVFIDPIFSTKETKIDIEDLPAPPNDLDIII